MSKRRGWISCIFPETGKMAVRRAYLAGQVLFQSKRMLHAWLFCEINNRLMVGWLFNASNPVQPYLCNDSGVAGFSADVIRSAFRKGDTDERQ
jgi:hypothetical protein